MDFNTDNLLKVDDIITISHEDLLSIHNKNLATVEAFCDEMRTSAENKTQKTKAKKKSKDLLFNLKYNQDKEMNIWLSKHTEHKKNSTFESKEEEEDDTSPEALLKHINLNSNTTPKNTTLNTENNQEERKPKKNRQKERKLRKKIEHERLQKEAAEEAALLPNLKKIEEEALNLRCKSLELKQEEIKADGHCLYYSILDQLKQRHSASMFSDYAIPKSFKFFNEPAAFYENLNIQTLRQLNVSYLKENKEKYELILFDESTDELQDFDKYCEKMENTAAWGGEIELAIFTKIFNSKIFILQENSQYYIGDDSDFKNPELKLIYFKHTFTLGEHYGSLRDLK